MSGYDKQLYTPEARTKRFKRIAEKRTNRILNDLRLLGNCANKTLYKYEVRQVDKIFETISNASYDTKLRFQTGKTKEFKL